MSQLSENTKRQLNSIVDAIDEKIDNKLDAREVEFKKNSVFGRSNYSNGLRNTLNKNIPQMQNVLKGNAHSYDFEIKASDITEGSGSGSYIVEDYGGNRSSLRSYFDLASLFPQYNASGGSVRFVTENSEDNQFGIVAEASASTQSDVQFKEVKKSLETIRSFGVISEELLSEGDNLEQFVRSRFIQQLIQKQNNELINGTGNISSLNGNKVDCPTDGTLIFADSVDNAQNLDVLKAVVGQQQNSGFNVDLIIISPKEMYNLQFIKDSNNNYIQGGLDVVSPNYARMGGINIYSTEALSGDSGFAVDTQKFGVLCRKDSFDAKLSSDGKNALVYNVAYLRLMSRLNMAVLNSSANMKFDFSDVKSALETP